MTDFRTGTVAAPVRLLKPSPRLVLDAQLASAGPFARIIAKVLPMPERCIEAVCAWLGRDIGLPIPEPCLPLLPRARLPKGTDWIFGDTQAELVFATIAIDQAQQLIRVDGGIIGKLLDNWPHLARAAAFDELIANDDRTEGNILLGPRQDLWLIDHSRSLGGAGSRLFSSDINPLFTNFFLHRIATFPASRRLRMREELVTASSRLVAAVPRIPYDQMHVPSEIARQIDTYLQIRAKTLRPMVLNAIGLPELPDAAAGDARGGH